MNEKIQGRINALVTLGEQIRSDADLENVIAHAAGANPWFTIDFCSIAVNALTDKMLSREKLEQWLSRYEIREDDTKTRTVGIIMAGNLPLVGFHDFLCVYVAGYNIKVKLSGKDDILFKYVYEKLIQIDPSLAAKSAIIERLEGFDAVIATGSNNSNRYFEYYFRNYPKILRKNRNSVAILSGKETDEELFGLADDIFMYFGFGCRNVSKLYVPQDYDITKLFPYFDRYQWMHSHTKYMNNYDYNRTLLLLNRTEHLSNDVIMIQETDTISSPASVLYFQRYEKAEHLLDILKLNLENIQCIVSNDSIDLPSDLPGIVKMGYTQRPELSDYADNVDTLEFLFSLKSLN